MEKLELTNIINKCVKAVEESVLGPIITKKEDGTSIMNLLPLDTYKYLLGSELPHISITNMKQSGKLDMNLEEGGETWKKES